ncbi:hypothetical protein BASA62_002681 [Batrachochytrium salamandrivorans]|nr:hypothetical protein BASA62_002681 [Batrachochytrium salamandrivorans]
MQSNSTTNTLWTFEDVCDDVLSHQSRTALQTLLRRHQLQPLVDPVLEFGSSMPLSQDAVDTHPFDNLDIPVATPSISAATNSIPDNCVALAKRLVVANLHRDRVQKKLHKHTLIELPKRYTCCSSQEQLTAVVRAQRIIDRLSEAVSQLLQNSKNQANDGTVLDAHITEHSNPLQALDSNPVTKIEIILILAKSISALALLLQDSIDQDKSCSIMSLLSTLSNEDVLSILCVLFDPDDPSASTAPSVDTSDGSFNRIVHWLLFQRLVSLKRRPDRTLVASLRVIVRARSKTVVEGLMLEILREYSQQTATSMIESTCNILKELFTPNDRLYLVCAISGQQDRQLILNELMVPLLDMIPTKLSEKLSETRIDAVIFFLQQFEPDVQSRNVKFASAVLGLCNAFKSTTLMPHQFKTLKTLASTTTTFLRRKLVSTILQLSVDTT